MDLSANEGEIPIPISSTYVGGHSQSHGHSIIHDSPPPLHHPSNGPPPPSSDLYNTNKKGRVLVKYRECLKNHAASIGGNATDGCGEFMPNGEEGSLEALRCSACNCHRNFHRKEIEGESSSYECFHHFKVGRKVVGGGHKGVLISGSDAFGYDGHPGNSLIPRPSMIMPLGAFQTSESDEMEGGALPRPPMVKKRFRTKFTPDQKEKMLAFAEKVGWRLQKQEEGVVQQFCQEIGVRRRVLKVWMHNNKLSLAKKSSSSLQIE